MEFQMKKRYDRADLPERLQYTKYYEHDLMLRVYANRAMVLAMLFAVIASASLGFAIYVRVQPPTTLVIDDPLRIGECFFEKKTELQEIVYQTTAGELRRRLEAALAGSGWEINNSDVRYAITNGSSISGA